MRKDAHTLRRLELRYEDVGLLCPLAMVAVVIAETLVRGCRRTQFLTGPSNRGVTPRWKSAILAPACRFSRALLFLPATDPRVSP